ncbi:MAG: Sec-independent protein translocase subunit TatA/TatB [Anaerolineae bacterium]
MNIFGVGGAELVLILVIALIVAGPKRMIRWAYTIGQYVGKFRILWEQMVDMLQDEVDAAGLDVKLPKEIPTKQSIAKTASDLIKPYAESLEKSVDEVRKPVQDAVTETGKVVDDANKAVADAKGYAFRPPQGSTTARGTTDNVPSDVDQPATEDDEGGQFGAWSKPKVPTPTDTPQEQENAS